MVLDVVLLRTAGTKYIDFHERDRNIKQSRGSDKTYCEKVH